jgi:hypothetical protein
LGQRSIIAFHDPGDAHADRLGRAFAAHGTSRFAGRGLVNAAIGLAATRRRCDNPSLIEPSQGESGVAKRKPARRSTQD